MKHLKSTPMLIFHVYNLKFSKRLNENSTDCNLAIGMVIVYVVSRLFDSEESVSSGNLRVFFFILLSQSHKRTSTHFPVHKHLLP